MLSRSVSHAVHQSCGTQKNSCPARFCANLPKTRPTSLAAVRPINITSRTGILPSSECKSDPTHWNTTVYKQHYTDAAMIEMWVIKCRMTPQGFSHLPTVCTVPCTHLELAWWNFCRYFTQLSSRFCKGALSVHKSQPTAEASTHFVSHVASKLQICTLAVINNIPLIQTGLDLCIPTCGYRRDLIVNRCMQFSTM